jgi:hypothetical protein
VRLHSNDVTSLSVCPDLAVCLVQAIRPRSSRRRQPSEEMRGDSETRANTVFYFLPA